MGLSLKKVRENRECLWAKRTSPLRVPEILFFLRNIFLAQKLIELDPFFDKSQKCSIESLTKLFETGPWLSWTLWIKKQNPYEPVFKFSIFAALLSPPYNPEPITGWGSRIWENLVISYLHAPFQTPFVNLLTIGTSCLRCSLSLFRRLTGNSDSGPLFSPFYLFSTTTSLSQSFLIEKFFGSN